MKPDEVHIAFGKLVNKYIEELNLPANVAVSILLNSLLSLLDHLRLPSEDVDELFEQAKAAYKKEANKNAE